MKVLVSNVGSTSLKFKLFDMPAETVLCEGKVERVGSEADAIFSYRNPDAGFSVTEEGLSIPTYTDGILRFLGHMTDREHGAVADVGEIGAVGFKTVLSRDHYGDHELTEEVLQGMRDYLVVAPAHNGPYLEAIGQFKKILPDARMVGAFETAFHTTIPLENRLYAVPYEWYEKYGVMKMGYHGASHSFIASQVGGGKVISCHLGGSCSLCAIDNGKSVDSSFGFSLQTGIPHSTRVGDADMFLIPFMESRGMDREEIYRQLSKNSGLLGISGVSGDFRHVQEAMEAGDPRAALAIDVFVTALVRTIGAFHAELGGLDTLVFTGGIGEHSPLVRERVCRRLAHLGVRLDEAKNNACTGGGVISADDSPVRVLAIPANEELGVARRTVAVLEKNG